MSKGNLLLICIALVGLTLAVVTGLAQDVAPTPASPNTSVKIGFINSTEVFYGTAEGKRAMDGLNQFAADRQQQVQTERQELGRLQQEFAGQLNPETRAEMQRTIEAKQITLKRLQEDVQSEYNRRQNEILADMSGKVQGIIDEYAKEHNFTAIFYRDATQVYIDPATDITMEIIEIYNQRHPAAAAASTQ
ncbi:MAG: OmpH family outer membrane protein [Acidobacteriota bacterium]